MGPLTQDRMTKNERMTALLNRQPLDRVPVYGIIGGFAAVNVGYTIRDLWGDLTGEKAYQFIEWTTEQYGLQDLYQAGYLHLGVCELGGDMSVPSGEFDMGLSVARYPVTTEEESWKLELPDVKQAGIIPHIMRRCRRVYDKSSGYLFLNLPGPWEIASNICGLEHLCRWAIKKPELAHRLLRLGTDMDTQIAQYWAESFDIGRFLIFSTHAQTSNQVISPKVFQEFCLPYIKETHENYLTMGYKHILCHICGEQNLNLPHWAQIPMGHPGITSFGHEVDLDEASKHFLGDIIMGNIEPACIQSGTPEQVYELARVCIEKGKKHSGGFMLAAGCEMPPKAPPYNVWTITKAARDFGTYNQ